LAPAGLEGFSEALLELQAARPIRLFIEDAKEDI